MSDKELTKGCNMKNLTEDLKIKIIARGFYDDNSEDYESYAQAVKEMTDQVTPDFRNSYCQMTLTPKFGSSLLANTENGHLAYFRHEDGFFECITEMNQEEIENLDKKLQEILDDKGDDYPFMNAFKEAGWVELDSGDKQ